MASLLKQFSFDVDIHSPAPLLPSALGYDFVSGEAAAHQFVLTVTNNGADVSFAGGSAAVYVIRPDGQPVMNSASADGNVLSATLNAASFAIPGRILLQARATVGGATKVLLCKYATVRDGVTGAVIDPGQALPNQEEIAAYIAAWSVMEDYDPETAYNQYNHVFWNPAAGGDGSTYQWTSATPSVPGTDPGESASWQKVAQAAQRITVLGTYADLTALRAAVPSPSVGHFYNVGAAAPYNVYRATGLESPDDWEDQGTLCATISTDDPLMNGTASPGASGEAADAAHVHPSDTTRVSITEFVLPNGFLNWDFRRNPVNQELNSGGIASGYIYDQWKHAAGTVTINAGYLALPVAAGMDQPIEGNAWAGRVATISVMIGGVVYSGTGTFPSSAGTSVVVIPGFGTVTLGYATGYMYVRLAAADDTRQVQCCELVPGTHATLAKQPPMIAAQQLAACQRYLEYIGPGMTGKVYAGSTARITMWGRFMVEKRVAPTFSFVSGATIRFSDSSTDFTAASPSTPAGLEATTGIVYRHVDGFTGLTAGTSMFSRLDRMFKLDARFSY